MDESKVTGETVVKEDMDESKVIGENVVEEEQDVEMGEDEKEERTDDDSKPKLFSSDDFKIEIQNLPRFFGMGQLKKLFNKKLKLNSHKIKPCGPKSTYMYVCFKNEEDKAKAISVLDGYVFKNNKLRVKEAKFVDPYKKKQQEQKRLEQVVDNRPTHEKLQDAVCPLAREPYEEQLSIKQSDVNTLIKRLGSEISRSSPTLTQWIGTRCNEFGGTLAPVENFVRSPCTMGYRNKCEFSIGYMTVDKDNESDSSNDKVESAEDISEEKPEKAKEVTKKVSVGFRLASYKAGSVEVISLSHLGEDVCNKLPQISQEMVKVVVRFEQLVRASPILPYCSLDRRGNWRNLMMRTSRGVEGTGEVMVVVVVDPQDLSSSTIDQLRTDLTTFFRPGGPGAGADCGVTSLFLHLSPARREPGGVEPAPELLFGPPSIQETLMGRTFSVSPQAFFQVNTLAAEVLYRTVGDIAGLTKKTSLVDVCCGTGTIGLCLADRVGQVVGVELIQEAVRDAIRNAETNKVDNCKFYAGRAEEILGNVLRNVDSKEVVAIVDPPRAGLHPRALAAIRNTPNIQRLVYVSCDAKNAMKNFVDLSRPASKTAKGDPFLPVKVIPVDLFPHTRGFELVLLFERIPMSDILNSELSKRLAEEEKESLETLVSMADKTKEERERVEGVKVENTKENIADGPVSIVDFLNKL